MKKLLDWLAWTILCIAAVSLFFVALVSSGGGVLLLAPVAWAVWRVW